MGSQVKITFPDGKSKSFPSGTNSMQVAESISPQLAKRCVAAKVNGEEWDLSRAIERDSTVELITEDSKAGLEVIRHSTAHLMAMAVQALFPKTQVTIGPVVEDGFYYDYHSERPFTPEDLEKIEKKMAEFRAQNLPITRKLVSRDEAIKTFEKLGEHFKVEIIKDLPADELITIYHQGDWFDLCRGPHVPHTGKLRAFKLTSVAGAFWRGDEKNPRLQRIYGTAFATQKELDEYLVRLEEAKKRDHRKLGRELQLFMFRDEAPAMPFFYSKGQTVYNLLIEYIRHENRKRGYHEVVTPLIMDVSLWKKSGHWDHYQENMYFTKVDERMNAVKPMNCPGHVLLFGSEHHSYRELPIRISEFGRVHRFERSGVTHGLMRVRNFIQDDGHLFCSPDQIEGEVVNIIDFVQTVYKTFEFSKIRVGLSTRPQKSMGSEEVWKIAETALANALQKAGLKYDLYPGDGAFYGPKIDFHVEDSIGRLWQCGTCQLDFQMPGRFEVTYVDPQSKAQTPVMIHRAIIGSVERFMGVLIEHYSGAFPFWIAPEQIRVVNITDAQGPYAQEVAKFLKSKGFRVELDDKNEKLGAKIRVAQLMKVPYTLVIGDKEKQNRTVTVRPRQGEQMEGVTWDKFLEHLEKTELNPLRNG